MHRNTLAFAIAFLAVSEAAHVAYAAGHYELASWRQKGPWDNGPGTGCLDNHTMSVRVLDEAGSPRAGMRIKTARDVLLGTTDADVRAEIPIDVNNVRYDMKCIDGSGPTSDVALERSSCLPPCG